MPRNENNDRLLLGAFLLSGLVALGYQMVWTRLLALVLGGELLGMLGVLAGFFLGMVLGAYFLSAHAGRTQHPARMFILLESVIAIYGLISPYLIYGLADTIPTWLGPVAGDNDSLTALFLSLLISSLVLLPATFSMGANFAYLAEAQRRILPDRTADTNLGRMYAANTFGATLGTLAGVYVVLPRFGFVWSCCLFSLAGVAAVACVWLWARNSVPQTTQEHNDNGVSEPPTNQLQYLGLLFATGMVAIGLEIVVIHLLKQILENTIFTFANILSVYLVGTSMGAWFYQYGWLRQSTEWQQRLPAQLILGMLISMVISFGVLTAAPELIQRWAPPGAEFRQHLMLEFWIAILVFLLPTVFMGALFSFLIGRIAPETLGKAYALNTLGAAVAPFVIGLLLIPTLAPFHLLAIVWVCYWVILGSGVYFLKWKREYFVLAGIPFLILVFGLFSQPDLIRLPNRARELQRVEGLMGTVVVSERKDLPAGPLGLPHRVLQVNNHFRMGGGAGFLERRMGNLPLLLAKEVEDALFLGIGTGTTMGVCQDHPTREITAVEIVPEVKHVLNWFESHNKNILEHPGLSYHSSDARRFVSATERKYDVIVADLYHPARDGAGWLYTQEHFRKLKLLLKENGLLCQWLPAHQFDQNGLKTVLRTFRSVFSETHVFLAGYNTETVAVALIGTEEKLTIDFQELNRRIGSSQGIQEVFEHASDIMSTYLFSGKVIDKIVETGALNTDLNPVLLFDAPRSVFVPENRKARTNLRWLLSGRQLWDESIWSAPQKMPESIQERVTRMWRASGLFMESKMSEQQNEQKKAWDLLVQAYRTQPDFSPARGRLIVTALQNPSQRSRVLEVLNNRDRNRLNRMIR